MISGWKTVAEAREAESFPTPVNSMQVPLGLSDLIPATGIGALGIWMFVSFAKMPRGKCSNCGIRRVLYVVRLGDTFSSPGKCGKCAGIR